MQAVIDQLSAHLGNSGFTIHEEIYEGNGLVHILFPIIPSIEAGLRNSKRHLSRWETSNIAYPPCRMTVSLAFETISAKYVIERSRR